MLLQVLVKSAFPFWEQAVLEEGNTGEKGFPFEKFCIKEACMNSGAVFSKALNSV